MSAPCSGAWWITSPPRCDPCRVTCLTHVANGTNKGSHLIMSSRLRCQGNGNIVARTGRGEWQRILGQTEICVVTTSFWDVQEMVRGSISDMSFYLIFYKKNPWSESTSELCQPSDRRFSEKLVSQLLQIDGATRPAWRTPTAVISVFYIVLKNCTPWPESASELYRPSDRLSVKLV
jgi:hypothetical protein